MQLRDNMTILFQGDSITDAWRTLILPDGNRPFPLGTGYAYMVAARLTERYPGLKLNIVNRGVSGDRVRDLQRRWKADCLDVRPGLVSILVGINDTWRTFDAHDASPIDEFRDGYRSLLRQVKDACDPVSGSWLRSSARSLFPMTGSLPKLPDALRPPTGQRTACIRLPPRTV